MPPGPSSLLTRSWLREQRACDTFAISCVDGGGTRLTRAYVAWARAQGIRVLWPGVRLMRPAGRRRLLDQTLAMRRGYLASLVDEQRTKVEREIERDETLRDVSGQDADSAIRSTLIAGGYAGLDQEDVRTELIEFVEDELGLE